MRAGFAQLRDTHVLDSRIQASGGPHFTWRIRSQDSEDCFLYLAVAEVWSTALSLMSMDP